MTFDEWWNKLTGGFEAPGKEERLALAKAAAEAAWHVGYNEGMKKATQLVEEFEPHKEGP